MVKRKLKQSPKLSDDEIESRRPAKQFKKRKNSSTESSVKNIPSFSKVYDSEDSDICNLDETSGTVSDDIQYETYSSFLQSLSFCSNMNDSAHQNSNDISQNTLSECEISMNESKSGNSSEEVSHHILTSHEEEVTKNISILSIPTKLSQVIFLQNPASLTLHGYVDVSVWFGNISIFGYEMKKGEHIKVFSTEGTGLKKIITSGTTHEFEMDVVKKKLKSLTCFEDIDIEEYTVDIETSCVIVVKKLLLPAPLRFLELYYPKALLERWPSNASAEQGQHLELCSTKQSYVIDVSGDFESLSKEVNKVISQPVSDDADFGYCILVHGEKNLGKSTLIKYLMNSSLNKCDEVYFLDTDLGQTEYTPPGVVSLFRVTKPLLGPSFAHQKKPLRMIFTGSITPGTCPKLYETSIKRLVKYFNDKFRKNTLFVNTMGWTKGMGGKCLQEIKLAVKPTIEIELLPPGPNALLTKEVENEVTVFKIPSKAPSRKSGTPFYSPVEIRSFNLVAYLGRCQRSYLPPSLINSFHPVCISWDKVALYVMGKMIPASLVTTALCCSIVALCHVNSSDMLESSQRDLPLILRGEPICECLGFGFVRASDETNRLFYIVTPLTPKQLKNVNALVKGNIVVPEQILLKQTIEDVPLPFTTQTKTKVAKNLGLKKVPKRAFRNILKSK